MYTRLKKAENLKMALMLAVVDLGTVCQESEKWREEKMTGSKVLMAGGSRVAGPPTVPYQQKCLARRATKENCSQVSPEAQSKASSHRTRLKT